MQSKVFISHSSKDHEFVNKLVERLGKDDIDLFVDDWDIKVGDYIKEKIEKGLEECDFFMFILSKNSLQSKWVEEEIDIATLKMLSGKNIKILPVILDLEINEIPERFRAIRAAIFYHNEIKDDEYLKIIEQIRDSERAKALNKFQESFFSDLEYIDNIIKKSKNVNRTEVEIILNKIKNETYERYFFDHVDSEEWFEILKVNDFFVPDVKKLKPIDKGNGFFSLPYWDVLPYLEKLSKNEEFISKDENTKKLIEIIKNVTKILKDKNIDNSRIWDSFISIIINLPNNTIDFECIRLLEDWINTKFPIITSNIVNKLLPKFITDNSEDIEKAKSIFMTCLKIRKLDESITTKKTEQQFFLEKYWLYNGLIENKNARDLGGKLDNNKLIIDLLDYILNIFLYKYCNLETDIKKLHIKISYKEENKNNIILEINNKEINIGIEESKDNFINKCLEVINQNNFELDKKDMENIYFNIFSDYSCIWFQYIPEGSNRVMDETEGILIKVLIELITGYIENKNNDIKKQTLNILLSEKYKFPIFKRLYLFFIKEYNLFDEFINLINKMWDDLFNDYNYEVETYELLKHFAKVIQGENVTKIENIIEKGFKYYTEDEPEQYRLYWKQKWYSALQENEYFEKKYKAIKEKTKIDKEMIGVFRITTGSGYGKSPLAMEDILKMTNDDFVKFTFNFKNTDFESPTVQGLGNVLMAAAKENPNKFISDYKPLLALDYFYIYHIFLGFNEGFKIKKYIDFFKVFDFIKDYVSQDKFLTGQLKYSNEPYKANYKWALSGIAGFLLEITKIDEWGITETQFNRLEEIILFLCEDKYIKEKEDKEIHDYVTYALNSVSGKLIETFINFYLKKIRVEEKKDESKKQRKIKWNDNCKEIYDHFLILDDKSRINAYTLLGMYLPQFWYMDQEFFNEKINEIIDFNCNDERWLAFMQGHSYTKVYEVTFKAMEENYKKAIYCDKLNSRTREVLINHISLGYILDFNKKLFKDLIEKRNTEDICNVIKYFWHEIREWQKNNTNEKLRKKVFQNIFNFWDEQYSFYEDKQKKQSFDENDKKILSYLCLLTCGFISGDYKIYDPPYVDWLKQCGSYVDIKHNTGFFLEYLLRLVIFNKETANAIADIILKMLEIFIPHYDADILLKVVEQLESYGDITLNEKAKKIREIMVKKGHYGFKK